MFRKIHTEVRWNTYFLYFSLFFVGLFCWYFLIRFRGSLLICAHKWDQHGSKYNLQVCLLDLFWYTKVFFVGLFFNFFSENFVDIIAMKFWRWYLIDFFWMFFFDSHGSLLGVSCSGLFEYIIIFCCNSCLTNVWTTAARSSCTSSWWLYRGKSLVVLNIYRSLLYFLA